MDNCLKKNSEHWHNVCVCVWCACVCVSRLLVFYRKFGLPQLCWPTSPASALLCSPTSACDDLVLSDCESMGRASINFTMADGETPCSSISNCRYSVRLACRWCRFGQRSCRPCLSLVDYGHTQTPACTVTWVAWLCRSLPSLGEVTQISCGRNPAWTIVGKCYEK